MAKKAEEATIEIMELKKSSLTAHIIGSEFIMHRFAKKAWHELLFPKGRANTAEKATSLKHDPLQEFRESLYRNSNPNEPTLFHIPDGMFTKALAQAAIDLPGSSKAQILRLVRVASKQINVYGVPQMKMDMVRSSDMARTPDVRTRPIFAEIAFSVEIEFVSSLITHTHVANLAAAAGMIVGIGDWRPQKGGRHGTFKLVNADDPDYLRIISDGGRDAQLAAYEKPFTYGEDTDDLYSWFTSEVARREKALPSSKVLNVDNGSVLQN